MIGGRERSTRDRQRDRLWPLRSFCRVAQLGSIAGAAERLLIDPRIVSVHLRELEHEAGTPLLDRGGPHLDLTPAGERFLELALPLLEGLEGLAAALARPFEDVTSGTVAMAATRGCALFVLPRFLKRFRDQYPGIRVQVTIDALQNVLPLLRTGQLEFAFGREESDVDGLLYRPVSLFEIVLITPEDHPLAGRESVSWEEAAAWPIVMADPRSHSREFLAGANSRLAPAKVTVRTTGWSAIKRYVEAGLGVAAFPSFGVGEEDRLAVIPLRAPVERRSYGLFMRSGRYMSPAAKQLAGIIDPSLPPAWWRA